MIITYLGYPQILTNKTVINVSELTDGLFMVRNTTLKTV